MPELGPYGSVRGARGNSRPYRESHQQRAKTPLLTHSRSVCNERNKNAAPAIGGSTEPQATIRRPWRIEKSGDPDKETIRAIPVHKMKI
jgi:hypothetical protein